MFAISFQTVLEIILRSALIYLVLLAGLRLAGKREIGQLTVFDLVVLLLISNAVQNAMVGPDTSLPGGILAAVALLVLALSRPLLEHDTAAPVHVFRTAASPSSNAVFQPNDVIG